MVPKSPIEHVVLIIKENHSFDNYFGTFPGTNGTQLARSPNPPSVSRGHGSGLIVAFVSVMLCQISSTIQSEVGNPVLSNLAILVWIMNIVVDTVGHMAFKSAAITEHESEWHRWKKMLSSIPLWVGIVCFCLEFVLWLVLLSILPLSAASCSVPSTWLPSWLQAGCCSANCWTPCACWE